MILLCALGGKKKGNKKRTGVWRYVSPIFKYVLYIKLEKLVGKKSVVMSTYPNQFWVTNTAIK